MNKLILSLMSILVLDMTLQAYDIDAIMKSSKTDTSKGTIRSKSFVKDSKKSLNKAKDDFYWKYEYVSPSTSSSNNKVDFVSVSAEFTRGILNSSLAKNLQMSAADSNAFIGNFENGSYSKTSSHGAIYKGINGIAGYYNYSFQSDSGKIGCSGQIYVSGKKQNLRLNVYGNCKDAGSGEF